HNFVVFPGDEHLGHAIDDAAGDGEIEPAFAGFDVRLRPPRTDLQGSRRQGLQSHRHPAQQQQLNVESLLFEKSALGADPKRTISERLAGRAKIELVPLLGRRWGLEQKQNYDSDRSEKLAKHRALRQVCLNKANVRQRLMKV